MTPRLMIMRQAYYQLTRDPNDRESGDNIH